jgi:hypothetical protein
MIRKLPFSRLVTTPTLVSLFVINFVLISILIGRNALASFGPWGNTSLINACVDSRGRSTIVSPGTDCYSSETQTTWLKDVDAGSGLTINRSSSGATLAVGELTSTQLGTITKEITANLMGWSSETTMALGFGVRMMSSGGTGVAYTFAIPYDYQGGNITVREWYHIHDAVGTAKLTRTSSKMSSSGTATTFESGVSDDLTSASGGDTYRTYTISSSNVSSGDMFRVELDRNGDDSGDTMGRLDLVAVAVEYTGTQ